MNDRKRNECKKLQCGGPTPSTSTKYHDWDKTQKKYTVSGLNLFDGVKFCKPCTILLRGCSTAEGPEGKALLKAIANATKCKVRGWDQTTTELTMYEDLPGGGTFSFRPDVTVEPD